MADLVDSVYFQELAEQNPDDVCIRALCAYDNKNQFYTVSVWNDEYRVFPHQRKIECVSKKPSKLHAYFNVFIVHYLLYAKAIAVANQWISEKEIPDGATFFRGPHAIPTKQISDRFDTDIRGFKQRCEQLNGTSLEMADAAYVFNITPRTPVAVLYWIGDNEFPSESKLLFDKTISEHFACDVVFAIAIGVCEGLGRDTT